MRKYKRQSTIATNVKRQKPLRPLVGISENPNVEIESKLNDAGLESKYWLPIFRKELGVTSPHALMHIGEESFGTLQQFVRQPGEKKALRKLLGMKDEGSHHQMRWEEPHRTLQQPPKGSRDCHDRTVQRISSATHDHDTLQISPNASMPSSITPESRLEGDLDGTLRSRDGLLKLQGETELMGPSLSKHGTTKSFSPQLQEDWSRKYMGNLSHGHGPVASTTSETYSKAKVTTDHHQISHSPIKYSTSTQLDGVPHSKAIHTVAKLQQNSGNVHELFEKLGLLKHYPQKLTLQDALLVQHETLGDKQCVKLELLPYFILQKLMMHDYIYREVLFQERTTSTKPSQQRDHSDDNPPGTSSSSGSALSIVHPVDGLLALLHSSDNFLRQELMTKLSTCQLAIPFLLPDPFTHTLSLSLWAMRTIVKEWECTNPETDRRESEESPIVTYPTPIVSFCRLTSNRSEHSKSRLINEVISDTPHNYFFHFHCDGGCTESFLMDGLVELCWYLPAGKPTDPFAQVIAFTNLRCDATSHPTQTKFLSQVSFMNFVLLTEDNLNEEGIEILQDLAKAPGGIVLMFLDAEFAQQERMTRLMETIPKDKCFRMKLSGRSAADIKVSIRDQINKKLVCSQREFKTIEECAEVARDNGIYVDENDPDCIQGRELADQIQEALALAKAHSMKQVYRDELLLLVKKLVSTLAGGQKNDRQLEQLFEDKWIEWMRDLSQQIDQSKPDIEGILENCLRQVHVRHSNLLNPKLSKGPLRTRIERSLKFEVIRYTHITAKRVWGGVRKFWRGQTNIMAKLRPAHIDAAEQETQEFLRLAEEYLEEKRRGRGNFNPAFCNELLKVLLESISDAQEKYPDFNFTPEYKVDIALTVSGYALISFELMAKDFRQTKFNDPVEREMKTPLLQFFKNKYQQTAVQELFKKLDLLKYYPQKLTLQDAVLIRQETLGDKQCDKLELLPYFILQKLMMHDYQCRGVIFKERTASSSLALTKPSQQRDDFDDFDDIDDLFNDPPSMSSSAESALVHPMDGLLALLHSSDNFLRQELMTKLSTCQLAIPFLLTDPFTHTLSLSLWAMRRIIKEWKCTDPKTGKSESEACPIVSYSTPIVSFCRLTSNRSEHSKSRLLNDVISDSTHNHFFHFHCDGGSTKSFLMDGLVELCWYLPAGKPTDPFAQVIAFTNLRGDATSHPKQTKFLSQVSFMNFVLLTEDNLDEKGIKILQDLAKAPGGIVLMFLDTEFTQKERTTQLAKAIPKDQRSLLKLHGKGTADIKTSIREHINMKLARSQQGFRKIEDCAEIARDNGVHVDEDDPDCVQGRELAAKMQEALAKLPTSDKDIVLPLQSRRLWHEWARHDKERHRHINIGAQPIGVYNSKVEEQKDTIRMQQFSIAESPSPVMKTFLSNLLIYEGGVRNYFLQWLKFILDDHSRKRLPEISLQYQEVRLQLLKQQREHRTGKEEEKGQLKEKLKEINERLVHASFGLEHFLREIGQMYEATVNHNNAPQELKEQVNRLPQAAAELLASGYPLELMDGDASHLPLHWVMAVLDKLSELLQNARLFVLSVLGIQSSGKSTLLNTMFGLRFMVSAGRCTRGAFMQLLPFNQSLRKETNSDYLLIIDTEGLRAPELSSQETQKHDNELAAFVIGLANITLINIFGETPGDMDDILQRAVHAFIRMEHVGLTPSCQFVHQNVGAVSGASRGMMGRVNFLEKLNKMTRAAAEEESLEGHYTLFSHVINFNEEKDVWYFPGLWKGDPPMAPVNPGYSDAAQKLKSSLIKMTSVHCPITAFQTRIHDLWIAILHEDFIFSFKNTLENSAYNRLDAKYAQWSWEFQRRMLEWQDGVKHRIRSSPIDKLSDLKRSLNQQLSEEGTRIHADLKIQMNSFFEEDEQRDVLIQWQGRTEKRLDEVRIEQETDAQHHCAVLINARQALAKVDSMKQIHRDELVLLVKKLVSGLERGRLNDKELENLFEEKWMEWMTKLNIQTNQIGPNIEGFLEKYLKELLPTHHNLLNPKLSSKSLRARTKRSLNFVPRKDIHITATRKSRIELSGVFDSRIEVQPSHMEIAIKETRKFLTKAQQYLETKRNENFNQGFCHELLKVLLESITDAQEKYPDFNFTPEYKVDIALTVSGYALIVFERMAKDFRRMNDPFEYLQREVKTPSLRLFKSQYYQIAQEVTAAHDLCDLLAKTIEAALMGSLGQKIAIDMKTSSSSFATKKALKARILSDLAELRSFDDYAMYLTDVKYSVQAWVMLYTEQHCRQSQGRKTRLTQLAESELGRLVVLISDAAKKVTDSSPKAGIEQWLVRFHSELMTKLSLDLREMQEVVGDLKDLMIFTEELCKRLANLNIKQFESLYDMDKWDEQPHDILIKTLVGCCEQCPFCFEQCELTNPNHSGVKHSVNIHRPHCLGGRKYADTGEMVLNTCNTQVESEGEFGYTDAHGTEHYHPRKRYQDIYPTWTISPDSSLEAASYWKWFVANYMTEIADHFGIKTTEVPPSWRALTRERVVEELKGLYKL